MSFDNEYNIYKGRYVENLIKISVASIDSTVTGSKAIVLC